MTEYIADSPIPIAPESPIEVLHRLNWAAPDLAIRKRRDDLASLAVINININGGFTL
jgi:hypothetical protein